MMKIIFATANIGKLREAADVLGPDYEVISPADLGITEDIPETGATLQENSLQKARYLHEKTGLPCFADDTGLEVDALGGAPGIYSARYAGPGHDSQKNMDKLLAELSQFTEPASFHPGSSSCHPEPSSCHPEPSSCYPEPSSCHPEPSSCHPELAEGSRRARFHTVVTLILADGQAHFFEGVCEGSIAREKSGAGGFGYDPIFLADAYPGRSLAEVSKEEKNAVSHRGKALRAMAAWLKNQ